ncbi:MAG: NADH:flavin oxidoreductase/NADH oxidase family protein [Aureispira sp.]|nr:NADH:flavin oxidoreductase/NADH oxidase family protein [Aureispira sp.]
MQNLQKEFRLPNGTALINRIAKSAMSENMANKKHAPTLELIEVYKRWGKNGAGLLITGNIMVDARAIGEPRNVVVEDKRDFELLQQWASTVKGTGTHLWVQINHPGRQALEYINKTLVAPSAVPVKFPGRKKASKKIPRALSEDEILEIIQRYATTASILKEAGFTGVQIHGAHGYLVNQFLSPHTNLRKDQWGGSLENRARFVIEVYRSIRKEVGSDYPIGIKLNSADFQKGGFTEEESMEVIKMLSAEGIDMIEVSGGSYEAPVMMGNVKESTKKREAYFIDYIEKARKVTNTPLMLTGGFRTVAAMEEALDSNVLDIIGIARPFAVYPNLPNDIFTKLSETFPVESKKTGIKALDAGIDIAWYEQQLRLMGEGKEPNPNMSAWAVMWRYLRLILGKAFNKNKSA